MLAVTMVTMDCDDPQGLAEFWSRALQTEVAADWGDFVVLAGTPAIGLQRVESVQPGKNRLHLDLAGGDRAPEVARLVELGADVVRTHDVDGFGWTVMVDPAGNEFCVSDPHDGGEEVEPRTEGEGEHGFDSAPDAELGRDDCDDPRGQDAGTSGHEAVRDVGEAVRDDAEPAGAAEDDGVPPGVEDEGGR
ncbi:VOC family protein [uncultured Serinicoccus sp.]|uniref:VOC family protein n=1 Tax=uncultured Serinicoccus sp. TaxID=735514 RepID=UPI00260715A7|nr:VOC family protein [uncultured Serinicoccus sp.]